MQHLKHRALRQGRYDHEICLTMEADPESAGTDALTRCPYPGLKRCEHLCTLPWHRAGATENTGSRSLRNSGGPSMAHTAMICNQTVNGNRVTPMGTQHSTALAKLSDANSGQPPRWPHEGYPETTFSRWNSTKSYRPHPQRLEEQHEFQL